MTEYAGVMQAWFLGGAADLERTVGPASLRQHWTPALKLTPILPLRAVENFSVTAA